MMKELVDPGQDSALHPVMMLVYLCSYVRPRNGSLLTYFQAFKHLCSLTVDRMCTCGAEAELRKAVAFMEETRTTKRERRQPQPL